MSSVTYSLRKDRPLCTAKFLPTNSGTIVLARAHVLIGSRLPDESALYTFSSNRSTTYGGFLSERPIVFLKSIVASYEWRVKTKTLTGFCDSYLTSYLGRCYPFLFWPLSTRHSPLLRATRHYSLNLELPVPHADPPADDGLVRRLATTAGLASLGQHARRRAGSVSLGAALTAAHRVIDGVHGGSPHMRPTAQPPLPPRLAQADVHVIGVADHADGRPAGGRDPADLAGGEGELGPVSLAGGQGRAHAGRPAELASTAGLHFDVVDRKPGGDLGQR